VSETINWISVAGQMPDDDTTILVRTTSDSEPVWLGYHDGEDWITVCGKYFKDEITHWAEMPGGPK
jgi:hypothetical protein